MLKDDLASVLAFSLYHLVAKAFGAEGARIDTIEQFYLSSQEQESNCRGPPFSHRRNYWKIAIQERFSVDVSPQFKQGDKPMIFRSPLANVAIPEIALTEFVFQHADPRADKQALIESTTGRALTYGELVMSIERVAAGLAARGLKKGDVFAIYAPNCPEYAITFTRWLRRAVSTRPSTPCTQSKSLFFN